MVIRVPSLRDAPPDHININKNIVGQESGRESRTGYKRSQIAETFFVLLSLIYLLKACFSGITRNIIHRIMEYDPGEKCFFMQQ